MGTGRIKIFFKFLTLGLAVGAVVWVVRGKPGLNLAYALLCPKGLPFKVAADMWDKRVPTDIGLHSLREMVLNKGWEYELGAVVFRSKRLFEFRDNFYLYTVEHFQKNPISSRVDTLTRQQAREMSEDIQAV